MAIVHPRGHPAVEGLAVGLEKGYHVTKNTRKVRQSRHKGRISKKIRIARELVREIAGYTPYEKRVMELLRIRFVICCQNQSMEWSVISVR